MSTVEAGWTLDCDDGRYEGQLLEGLQGILFPTALLFFFVLVVDVAVDDDPDEE